MKPVTGLLLALAVFTTLPLDSRAGVLQPKIYTAPGGHYELRVDPGEREGAGAAIYTLRKDGRPLWSGDRSFTFADAVVDDDGLVGGYAYTAGLNVDNGEFVVAILDATGRTQVVERTPREGSRYLHTAGDPKAGGLFMLDRRLVVRVYDPDPNTDSEMWWIYRLADGQAEAKIQARASMPDPQRLVRVLDARPINGTPLVLVQWMLKGGAPDGSSGYGTRFALLDRFGKSQWSFDLAGDYSVGLDDDAEARLLADMNEQGAILDTTHVARFEVRQVATKQRLAFEVERDAEDRELWRARLVERRAFVQPEPVKPELGDVRPLHVLGAVTLRMRDAANASPIHDVFDFAVGGGHFAFVAVCDCESPAHRALTIVGGDGRLLREVALPLPSTPGSVTDHVAWSGGDRWLVLSSVSHERDTRSTAVRIDGADGSVTPIAGFDAPDIKALVAMADGGFLALTSEWKAYSSEETLSAFDVAGSLRWKLLAGQPQGSDLFDPADIALLPNGDIVVLENIGGHLKIHAPDGTFRRAIDLRSAWGMEPNYPTSLAIARDGSVVVRDFDGKPSMVRMTLDGKMTDAFDPVFADGRHFDQRGGIKIADDGRLWTSDGDALLRLDAHGKVDRVLGAQPDPDTLGNIAGFSVTPDGTSYAVDERTGAVHRFDAQGRRLGVDRPAVGDYEGRLSLPTVTVCGAGDVYVSRDRNSLGSRPDYVHYAADGTRIGIEALDLDNVSQSWIAQPGTTRRWVVGYDSVYLVDAFGKVVNRITRDADRRWLVQPGPADSAPDGSLALLSDSVSVRMAERRRVDGYGIVALYAADGTPTAAWPAPAGAQENIAYDGRRLAFIASADTAEMGSTIVVTDRKGTLLSRFKPDAAHPPRGVFFVKGTDTAELWVFDGRVTLTRYAAP